MKNIKFYFIAGLSLLLALGCNEDLLDIDNPNVPTTETAWSTPADAELGVNAIYNMFYKEGSFLRWIYFRYDLASDEGHSTSPWVELADWTRFRYGNYNFYEGNNVHWQHFYRAIYRANQVIAYVPDIEFENEEEKNAILGQAYFLRALYYFQIAILWEEAPLVLEPSLPEDEPEQRTQAEIWQQVEDDLTFAEGNLPPQWTGPDVGRATKGAAKALLAKAHMQQHEYEAAKQQLDWLVTGEGAQYYGLVENYSDNFTHLTENNRESVFEVQFSDVNNGGTGNDLNASMGFQRPQFFAPGGIGWQDGKARAWLIEEYKKETTVDGENDPRLLNNIFYNEAYKDFPNASANDTLVYGRNWNHSDWGNETFIKKYSTYYYRDREDYHAPNNFRIIRYADVLLMYAEVLNELGMTEDAYQYVDMVRERVNLAPLAEAYPEIGNDPEKFLERLQMERTLELNFEAVRWMDLKRWGLLENQEGIGELASRDPDFANFVLGKHHRLPLPQIEVDNNPGLNQHPEY